jgi:hypothetical protein
LDILEPPTVNLDDPIGDRVTQRMGRDVVGVASPAAGDLGADARLGGELLDEVPNRPLGYAITRPGRKERLGVFPSVPEVPPEQPNGVAVKAERRRREAPLLDSARKVDSPRLEIDVIGVERDEFPDPEAGVVGERDDRLISVLKIRRDGAGETHVPEVVDLVGFQPDGRSVVNFRVATRAGRSEVGVVVDMAFYTELVVRWSTSGFVVKSEVRRTA